MSGHHLHEAWVICQRHDLTPAERCVLMAIADHINHKTGQWRIGIHLIAAEAGISDSRTRKIITSLRRRGLLASRQHEGDRACTWWIPATATKAPMARPPRPSRPVDYSPEGPSPMDVTAQGGEALRASNTWNEPTYQLPREPEADPDVSVSELPAIDEPGFTAADIDYVRGLMDSGYTKPDAVRTVIESKKRREQHRAERAAGAPHLKAVV